MTETERVEKLIAKCRVLGKTGFGFDYDGAHYVINGSEVLLQEVYVTEGEFTIPEFVTDIFREDCGPGAFINCVNIKLVNNSQIKDMSSMFSNCINLTSLDLTEFDTSLAYDMSCMFENCWNLTTLEFGNPDTHNVKSMEKMFSDCNMLKKLNLKIDAPNLTSMVGMFGWCSAIEEIELDVSNTSKLTDMDEMFFGCIKLKRLVLDFDTQNLKSMSSMFGNCGDLEEIELGDGFTLPPDTDKAEIFSGCGSLKRIINKGAPICSRK